MVNQIFISYSHKDTDFIKIIRDKLSSHFDVWDDTKLRVGDDWKEGIDKAIRESFAVLLVMTPDASTSKYVTYEWSFAIGRDIPVIPVLYKGTPDIHPKLNALQQIDFTDGYKAPWEDLIYLLRKRQLEYRSMDGTALAMRLLDEGRQQRGQNAFHNAIDTFNEALKFAPPSLKDDLYYELGTICYAMKDYDNAAAYLENALKENRDNLLVNVALGDLYRKLADSETDQLKKKALLAKAQDHFYHVLALQSDALDSTGESIWGSLGGVFKRLQLIDEAIDAYSKAALVRQTSYPYNNLALLYMEKNDFQQMRDNLELVEFFVESRLLSTPTDPWAHNDLFVAKLVLEKVPDAKATLKRVKQLAPAVALSSLIKTLQTLAATQGLPASVESFIPEAIAQLEEKLKKYNGA